MERRQEKEEEEEEALTEEHIKDDFNNVFEYAGTQNSMGARVEINFVHMFDADLKLIEEWIQKPIEQIDTSLKAAAGIKELNEMVNNDFKCVDYKKKVTIPDDEYEENDIEVYENEEECIKTIFLQ